MGEQDMQVDRLRQLAKQRPVILNRVGCQDGEAHSRRIHGAPRHALAQPRSKASSRAAAMRRALSRAE